MCLDIPKVLAWKPDRARQDNSRYSYRCFSSRLLWKFSFRSLEGSEWFRLSKKEDSQESLLYKIFDSWAFLVAQLVKNPPAMREIWVWSLAWEDPLEKGKATHSSILAWRIPWTIQPKGSQRVRQDWVTFTFNCFEYLVLSASNSVCFKLWVNIFKLVTNSVLTFVQSVIVLSLSVHIHMCI